MEMMKQEKGLSDSAVFSLVDILFDLEREELFDYQKFFDIVPGYADLFKIEKSKLPYSINLLDEIHANENAHSRILGKLLQFNEHIAGESRYPILEHFLKYLGSPFAECVLRKPKITAEHKRIDLLVRDRDFSIIIENKINGAGDQEEQLQRYVEKLTADNVREENIYILYLSAEGGRPSESSWPETMRKCFASRYQEINYRDDVYHFLKETVLAYVAQKKESASVEFLKSALHQYIDYLEGRFYYREGERMMRKKMREYLEEKIGLLNPSLSASEKISLIRDNRAMLNEFSDSLYESENEVLRGCVTKAGDELYGRIKAHVLKCERYLDFGRSTSRIRFYPKGWKDGCCVSVVFDEGNDYDNLFIGIENKQGKYTTPITDAVFEPLRAELGECDEPNNHWVYSVYKARGRENVIDYFSRSTKIEELCTELIAMIENPRIMKIMSGK